MNEEQKTKAKEVHGRVTTWLEGLGVPANWAKVGAGIILGGAIGCMSTCQQSCKNVPSAPHVSLTVEQIQAVETIYEVLGGEVKYRIVPVEPLKK